MYSWLSLSLDITVHDMLWLCAGIESSLAIPDEATNWRGKIPALNDDYVTMQYGTMLAFNHDGSIDQKNA